MFPGLQMQMFTQDLLEIWLWTPLFLFLCSPRKHLWSVLEHLLCCSSVSLTPKIIESRIGWKDVLSKWNHTQQDHAVDVTRDLLNLELLFRILFFFPFFLFSIFKLRLKLIPWLTKWFLLVILTCVPKCFSKHKSCDWSIWMLQDAQWKVSQIMNWGGVASQTRPQLCHQQYLKDAEHCRCLFVRWQQQRCLHVHLVSPSFWSARQTSALVFALLVANVRARHLLYDCPLRIIQSSVVMRKQLHVLHAFKTDHLLAFFDLLDDFMLNHLCQIFVFFYVVLLVYFLCSSLLCHVFYLFQNGLRAPSILRLVWVTMASLGECLL